MFTGKYRRIYYYHLKKCGGSTLNPWLDTLTSDDRIQQGAWRQAEGRQDEVALSRSLFHWSDVLHSHAPLRMYAPDDTFCFTMLRDPIPRIVSQIDDFRRLSDGDIQLHPPEVRSCIEDSRRCSPREFLERHHGGAARMFLDNYLTRALAAGRMGSFAEEAQDTERLLHIALQSLENDYHLVMTTEAQDSGRNAFCAMVGLPPAAKIPAVNVKPKSVRPNDELPEAADILTWLTRTDRVIYQRACRLFEQQHARLSATYDTATFAAENASRLLNELRGTYHAGVTRFTVHQPIIGAGFHGRDGAGLPSCSVWTGPERCATIYIPAPPNMRLWLLVWIRGYADDRQRQQLRVRVDGKPVPHQFAAADGCADLLVVEAFSTRDFIRMELEVDETVTSGAPGDELYEVRERGIAFDSYGWTPA